MKHSPFFLIILLSSSLEAMPRMDIICKASNPTLTISIGVSRYSGDPYDGTVTLNGKQLPQKNVAQFMNNEGELFLKVYEEKAQDSGGPDLSGFKIRANKSDKGWSGTLKPFQTKVNPGPQTDDKSRPVHCEPDIG